MPAAFLLRPSCPPAVAAQLLRLRRARDNRPKHTLHAANCAADEAARDMCERFGFGPTGGSGAVWEAVTATLERFPPPPACDESGYDTATEIRWYQKAISDLKERMDQLPHMWPWTVDPTDLQPEPTSSTPNIST